jgi:ribonuclease-3
MEPLAPGGGAWPDELETALGHRFENKELLIQALTHGSLGHEKDPSGEAPRVDNERLEFLGDAVVGMMVAESLYSRFPHLAEGALTRMRATLVSRKHLAEVGAALELGKHLRMGFLEERSGGREKRALLANGLEAVIGALYLDAGIEAARMLIEARILAPHVERLHRQLQAGEGIGDFKSELQKFLQARKQGEPEYRTKAETGPPHQKQFFVEALSGEEVLAEGSGLSRKAAQQDAARRAMEKLRGAGETE